jgi:energy-coupling factor transporter transmembrane protein EcfT
MKNSPNVSVKNNIIFGLLFFFLFLIVGVYPLKTGGSVKIWSIILSIVFLLVTIAKPNLFTFLNKAWIQFGFIIGKIVSPIIMALIFFFVITPTGMVLRLLRKDSINEKNKLSYWKNRDYKIQNMKKQF